MPFFSQHKPWSLVDKAMQFHGGRMKIEWVMNMKVWEISHLQNSAKVKEKDLECSSKKGGLL